MGEVNEKGRVSVGTNNFFFLQMFLDSPSVSHTLRNVCKDVDSLSLGNVCMYGLYLSLPLSHLSDT